MEEIKIKTKGVNIEFINIRYQPCYKECLKVIDKCGDDIDTLKFMLFTTFFSLEGENKTYVRAVCDQLEKDQSMRWIIEGAFAMYEMFLNRREVLRLVVMP